MRQLQYALVALLMILAAHTASAQTTVEAKTWPEVQQALAKHQGKTVVLNFWATWCAPCVKELPYFEQLAASHADKGVVVVLASADLPNELKRVQDFATRKGLKSQVYLINHTNPNDWIDAVNKDWSGVLPATIVLDGKGQQVAFHAGSFTAEELEKWVQPFLP